LPSVGSIERSARRGVELVRHPRERERAPEPLDSRHALLVDEAAARSASFLLLVGALLVGVLLLLVLRVLVLVRRALRLFLDPRPSGLEDRRIGECLRERALVLPRVREEPEVPPLLRRAYPAMSCPVAGCELNTIFASRGAHGRSNAPARSYLPEERPWRSIA
jgi:hypothetical protein